MEPSTLFLQELADYHVVPRPLAYYFRQWSEFYMSFHQHDTMEIMYVMQGTCHVEFKVAEHQFHTLILKKGEFVLLNANVPHRLMVHTPDPCRMLNVEFSFEVQDELRPSLKELMKVEKSLHTLWLSDKKFIKLFDPDEVFFIMKSLVLELDSPHSNRLLAHLLFSQLLICIARIAKDTSCSKESPSSTYVQETIKFMQQNIDQNLQVIDLATHVNLHPTYLQRIFKQQMDVSMMEYLTILRMEKAKKLLLHTRIPIIEISNYSGINSRQYFHFLFKKYTSLTPSEFRESMHSHHADDSLKVVISDNTLQNK